MGGNPSDHFYMLAELEYCFSGETGKLRNKVHPNRFIPPPPPSQTARLSRSQSPNRKAPPAPPTGGARRSPVASPRVLRKRRKRNGKYIVAPPPPTKQALGRRRMAQREFSNR